MLYSGILPLTTSAQQVAACNVGQEVNLFGQVFVNSTSSTRVILLTLHRQAIGSAQSLSIEIPAKGKISWDKAVSMQPGDYLNASADAVGVNLLWSVDVDTGANPVATGFVIRGEYSNIASYAACDIVYKDGASFVAIRNTTGDDPETSPADWMLLLDGSGTAAAIDAIVAGAPADMDTLDKLAQALGDDPDFVGTISDALALKANSSTLSPLAFSGNMDDVVGIKKLAARRLFASRELI